jgi:MEMO1 family protein
MTTRKPAVAGQFYPANPSTLHRMIDSFLLKRDPVVNAKGVVVPHAGYIYSGRVAGAVFSEITSKRFLIVGPNHTGRGVPMALYPEGEWETPFGSVPIDAELNRALLDECPDLRTDTAAHLHEHCLEVQLPFLQSLVADVRFSAICLGTSDYSDLERLGHGIARAIGNLHERPLLIASSDMTHYESAATAEKQDRLAIGRIVDVDPPGLYRVVIEKDISMCGFAPTVAVLTACRDMGASEGRLVLYTNSGETSGDFDHVVAYAGMVVE